MKAPGQEYKMDKQEQYNFIDASKFTMATIKEHGMHIMASSDENATMEDLEKHWKLYVIPLFLTVYDNLKELVGENDLEEHQKRVWNNE